MADKKYILALDQGTTSSRSILFDSSGEIVSMVQQEFKQIFPQPGWVEHDPLEIWNTQLETARDCLAKLNTSPTEVSGLGITNQRETTVVWERSSGKPIYNAIVWQDRRTAEFCSQLKSDPTLSAMIQEKTGLVIDAYFSGSKLKWILDNVEGARTRALNGELVCGTIDTWLAWNLSGGKLHITDPSNASRTMLCNINEATWDQELLKLFDIPESLLPKICSSSEIYGETAQSLFGTSIPIAGIAGDQQAALFGQACHSPGMAKNTYGTGCFLLMNTGTERVHSQQNLLSTIAWKIGDEIEYAIEGSVFIAGAVVQWLRDQLGIIDSAAEIESLAATVESSDGVYFVPAFAGLGAPHWDGFARGTIVGLTRGSNKAHLARAALEAIAFQSKELIDAMELDSGIQLQQLKVDGGATENALLMQFQADLLNVPVVRSHITETTALGAAYLSGLATGVWAGKDEISSNWRESERFTPQEELRAPRLQKGWKRAVERSKNWVEEP